MLQQLKDFFILWANGAELYIFAILYKIYEQYKYKVVAIYSTIIIMTTKANNLLHSAQLILIVMI